MISSAGLTDEYDLRLGAAANLPVEHCEFRVDDWLLYTMESPNASGSRGLNFGYFHRRDGTLVATCVQEGLIRLRPPAADGA